MKEFDKLKRMDENEGQGNKHNNITDSCKSSESFEVSSTNFRHKELCSMNVFTMTSVVCKCIIRLDMMWSYIPKARNAHTNG